MAPTITSPLAVTGRVDKPFFYQATATGDEPITWGATGLPDGLSIDTDTGIISGTPTTEDVSNVTLTATNAAGNDQETLVITILAAATATRNFRLMPL